MCYFTISGVKKIVSFIGDFVIQRFYCSGVSAKEIKVWFVAYHTEITSWEMRTCDFYSQVECDWKPVNKGTTQGSVSGPHLLNVFRNDFNITLAR